jgi:ubiquinone/menaquinone biosynthesis C-methylase UbiE
MDAAIELLQLTSNDILFDVGAGEGNFIIRVADNTEATAIGIEICEDRANLAKELIKSKKIPANRCQMICGNALEVDLSTASCFFLYLTPRGLRLILDKILSMGKPVRVVTYMSPFPSKTATKTVSVTTSQHPGIGCPLFYYEL